MRLQAKSAILLVAATESDGQSWGYHAECVRPCKHKLLCRRLASRLAARDQALPKVQILEHGFGGFVRKFSKDPELCEGVEQ